MKAPNKMPKIHAKAAKAKAKFPTANHYLKVHASRLSTVIAVCDKSCLGKKFESGGLILDLETHRRFYDGELVSEEEVRIALCGASNVNVVGEKSVEIACSAMNISKAGVKKIGGVSHLQVYRV